MIFSCRFHRVCALPVPAEDDSSAGRALSPASVRSEPAWSTVDVNGVHVAFAELGNLEVVLFDILLVVEVSPAVSDNSSSISHVDELGCVAFQLKPCHALLILTDPGLAKVNEVRLQHGGVNGEVRHVGLKSCDVQSSHPHFTNRESIPFSRVVVQGSEDYFVKATYLTN